VDESAPAARHGLGCPGRTCRPPGDTPQRALTDTDLSPNPEPNAEAAELPALRAAGGEPTTAASERVRSGPGRVYATRFEQGVMHLLLPPHIHRSAPPTLTLRAASVQSPL